MHAGQCYVVLLTPPGRGAVATVLVAGASATAIVDRHFQAAANKPLGEFPIGRIVFGRWQSTEYSVLSTQYSVSAEELVACRTAENELEIHCHGGSAASRAIIDALVANGCRECDWPEWMCKSSLDRIAAEAQIALADATTTNTAAILLDQMHGALRRGVEAIVAACQSHDREQAIARLTTLAARGPLGLHLTKPWRVVLAGRPNVGKSSLLNAMLGYTRAIVFDEPGTTRDVVTATTAIDGWPVELSDTAGLRAASEHAEAEGIARARRAAATADLLVLVFDATQPTTADDQALVDEYPQALIVLSKCDQLPHRAAADSAMRTSSATRKGIVALLGIVGRRLVPEAPPRGEAVPFTAEQCEAIQRAHELAIAGDWPAAVEPLRKLLG